MFVSTEGILLRKTAYQNGYILKFYTQKEGVLTGFARQNKKQKALLMPLSLVNLSFQKKEKKSIQNLQDLSISVPYQSLYSDILKSNIVLFLNEMIEKTIQEEEVNESLFNFLKSSFVAFDREPETNLNFHVQFLFLFTVFLGFRPQMDDVGSFFDFKEGVFVSVTPNYPHYFSQEESALFKRVGIAVFEENEITLSNLQRKQIINLLTEYYQYHTGISKLKSLPVLQAVFA